MIVNENCDWWKWVLIYDNNYDAWLWRWLDSLTYLLSVLTDPQRDGVAPVSVPADGPISGVSQPVAKPLLFHKLRHPTEQQLQLGLG